MTLDQILKGLDGLYEKSGKDWHLTVSHCLTEPTCPTCSIRPEDKDNLLRYTATGDSIEEAIARSVELVHREVILGQRIEPLYPITNPDDKTYAPPILQIPGAPEQAEPAMTTDASPEPQTGPKGDHIGDDLPSYQQAQRAVWEERATALEAFIYDNEPAGDADVMWRDHLALVLQEAARKAVPQATAIAAGLAAGLKEYQAANRELRTCIQTLISRLGEPDDA